MAKVGIVMGSDSDMPIMSKAADILEKLGIDYEMKIISAHREPDVFFEYAKTAEEKGFKVIIAGAGMAAHLPGMCAAIFPMPVIGIPAGTWADTKAADMQECLYEALAPYAGKSVLQAIGEQHGLGFLMADGTLTVAQASVISGTDSDPRFEQYYALLPEKQPDVILYDDAEVRDMAEFHAWIEQHFTITDRYTVQHGTASLQVLVVG